MRKAVIQALALPFTFMMGLSVQLIWERSVTPLAEVPAVADATDEEWHRLWEAAWMTADRGIVNEVSERLMCANSAGVADAFPVEVDGRAWTHSTAEVWCQKRDRSTHLVNQHAEYGVYLHHILDTHAEWSLRNIEFARTVVSPATARSYVLQHEWPSSLNTDY
jgi:hypothetical protein